MANGARPPPGAGGAGRRATGGHRAGEILRGPASSLYGADAIGGVINIITRQGGTAGKLRASIGAGSDETVRTQAAVSGGGDGWRYAVSGGYGQSAGFSAIANTGSSQYNPDRDGYAERNVRQLSRQWQPGHSLDARYLYSRVNSEYDGSKTGYDRTRQIVSALSLASNNQLTSWWHSRPRLGETLDDSTTYSQYPRKSAPASANTAGKTTSPWPPASA